MSKLNLLILDANVVIHLHESGIWMKLIAACNVHLPRTVVDEADFYDADGDRRHIELTDDIEKGRIQIFDVGLAKLQAFQTLRTRFSSITLFSRDSRNSWIRHAS